MGCGCKSQQAIKRPMRNLADKKPERVMRAVETNRGSVIVPPSESQGAKEERRKSEKLRRDAILRALGRP